LFQRIITEHFEVGGAEYCQEMVLGGQRYHRVTAQNGSVELVYDAVIDAIDEVLGDPSRLQVPLFEQILLKPWFSFTQVVFVSLIYWLDLRNGSSTKTSLGSIELLGYAIGSPNELNICPEQRLQRRRPSTRLRN
jgi:hypothetical protein